MRLIEKVWFHQHRAKWLLVPLLLPLSALFWLVSTLRRFSFKLGLSKAYKLSKPVIVVGNIGVGGNGKTPMVIYLVQLTRALGFNPGVISRGYGGQAPHYPYVVTDDSSTAVAGDEPVLIQQRCQVPVAVGSDRIASAKLLIAQGCNIIISDDGLQHYRLVRDLELVIVDGKRLFGNGLLLPAGPLREGQWRLAKSDLVIFNGKSSAYQLNKNKADNGVSTTDNLPAAPLHMTLQATEVCHLLSGERLSLAAFVNSYGAVNAIAGIGAPQRFFDTLTDNNVQLITQQGFVDHHHFTDDDFHGFDDNIALLMTEKDAVKCRDFAKENWWYLPVDASFSQAEQQVLHDKVNMLKLKLSN